MIRLSPLRLALSLVVASLLAIPVARAHPESWQHREGQYWCLARMLEKEPLCGAACDFEPLFDLENPAAIRMRMPAVKVAENASAHDRYLALKGFPIEQVTAAPGHVYLRNPKQLAALKDHIAKTGGEFAHDPLLFNFITDHEGNLLTVDLWNAHHRLVAYLEAGFHSLDEIPEKNFKILVNGRTTEGWVWPHYLPAGGLDETSGIENWVVSAGHEVKVGTVSVEGKHENFKLGSRTTVGKLRRNMLYRKQPKIGVYFGSFDPPHMGHMEVIREAREKMGFDEIVVVANASSGKKPNMTPLEKRLPLLRAFVKGEPRVNLYVGDTGLLVNRFGTTEPLIERLAQTYGTHDLYQIIGEDSYVTHLKEHTISPETTRKYVVLPRAGVGDEGAIVVPDAYKHVFTILPPFSARDLSSTMIRRLIAEGKPVDESILPFDVLLKIHEEGLYRSP